MRLMVINQKKQSIDPLVQAIKYFITDKVLPKQQYRNLIKRWGPDFFEKNGIIMIRYARAGYPTRDLVIAPGEKIANIIAEAHGSLFGGHSSSEKTVQQILAGLLYSIHHWDCLSSSDIDILLHDT